VPRAGDGLQGTPFMVSAIPAVLLWLTLTLTSFWPGTEAGATEVSDLYTARVTLDPDDENSQARAYRTALLQVLVKVTGSQIPATMTDFDALFPNPSRYVLQLRGGAGNELTISFDGEAIQSTLRNAGHPVWGSDRPLTLIWLAVDRGGGEREIVSAEAAERLDGTARSIDQNQLLRERVRDVAAKRGIPVLLPLLDVIDLNSIRFSDIWGGFDDELLEASKRYGVDSVLVGRLRLGGVPVVRWRYYFAGNRQEWSDDLEDAIHRLADIQAAQFAFSGSASLETVALRISGVDSVESYARVQGYLAKLPQLEGMALEQVVGDRLEYRVQVRGGSARLERVIEGDGRLERIDSRFDSAGAPVEYGQVLDYLLRPIPNP
jgi:hypothetical protein